VTPALIKGTARRINFILNDGADYLIIFGVLALKR